MPPGPALAADDAAGLGVLAAEELDPQHLRIRVAAVAARALPFLVCHRRPLLVLVMIDPDPGKIRTSSGGRGANHYCTRVPTPPARRVPPRGRSDRVRENHTS